MKDLKTTVTAIVGVAAVLAAKFGVHAGPDVQLSIITLTMFLIGLFAKDADGKDE